MAKPIKSLDLHYPMIQFLLINIIKYFTAVIRIFMVVIIWQQPQSFNLVSEEVPCMVKILEFLLCW